MTHVPNFDATTADQLRKNGSVKWTRFPGTIGAFVAEMDFGTAPAVTAALHDAVDLHRFGYLPEAVSTEMSVATAQWCRTAYGWDVPAERIHPLADVITALVMAIEHFSAPGSKVILPTPAYMPFFVVPGRLGREIIRVPLLEVDGTFRFDLEGLECAFHDGGNLLILCNPYNPVGRVFDREELLAVSEVVARNGGRVFSDEIHAPMVYHPARHVPYASVSRDAAAHTLTATSASKAWNLPGLKCAQVILSSGADVERFDTIRSALSHGASNLGVLANTAAYTSGGQWLSSVIEYNDGNRHHLADLLREHIPSIRYTPPEGTYIAWLDVRHLNLGEHPSEFFRTEAGVAMTDGADCGAPAGFLRFVFATPRPIITQAVLQMAQALRKR